MTDERVCIRLSVCPSVREHIFGTTYPVFSSFLCMLRRCLWLLLGHLLAAKRYDTYFQFCRCAVM